MTHNYSYLHTSFTSCVMKRGVSKTVLGSDEGTRLHILVKKISGFAYLSKAYIKGIMAEKLPALTYFPQFYF